MAYYNSYTKKRGVGKTIAKTIMCLLFVAIIACGGAYGMGYALTKDANPANWKNYKLTTDTTVNENMNVAAVTDDGLVVSLSEPNAEEDEIMTLSAEVLADSDSPNYVPGRKKVSLTAVVTPSNAVDTDVTWLIDFVNPDSTWASGKHVNEFVTLTEQASAEPAKHKIELEKVAEFAEQICVTVKSNDNPSISASCLIDCLAKIGSHPDVSGIAVLDSDGNTNTSFALINKENMGIGTIYGDFQIDEEYLGSNYCVFYGSDKKSVKDYHDEKFNDLNGYCYQGEEDSIKKLLNASRYPLTLNFDSQTCIADIGFNMRMAERFCTICYIEDNGDEADTGGDMEGYIRTYGGGIRFYFGFKYCLGNIKVDKVEIILNLTFDNTAVQIHVDDVTVGDNIIF